MMEHIGPVICNTELRMLSIRACIATSVPDPWRFDTDPHPTVTFKMPTKSKFFAYYLTKVHLHQSLKIASFMKSQERRNQGFLIFFLLVDGRIRIHANIYGSESGRPKNVQILRNQIRNTDGNGVFTQVKCQFYLPNLKIPQATALLLVILWPCFRQNLWN